MTPAQGLPARRTDDGPDDSERHMKLFGWKAAGRAEARPVLAHGHGVPVVIGEWPRSYEAQVREAYLGNAIAQRAVKLVAEGVGSAPVAAS